MAERDDAVAPDQKVTSLERLTTDCGCERLCILFSEGVNVSWFIYH